MFASLPSPGGPSGLVGWLAVIHVLSALILLAPSGAFAVLGKRSASPETGGFHMLEALLEIEKKYVLPGAVVQLLTGAWLMYKLGYDRNLGEHLWLSLSIVLFLALLGLATAVDMPAIRRIVAAARAGTAPAAKDVKISKTLGPILGLLFIIIAFLMSAKPF